MIIYDPISQGNAVIQHSGRDQVVVISYPPSMVVDGLAAVGQLTDSASTRSFMQNQWRTVADNMHGLGSIVNGYW
ncbi:MAG: hypothetical protein LBR31_06865 [Desulfovibrio sp.]|jgi:hypothetical protein|nr:hypothetical protein [Desulfovibrio sp.]